MYWQRQWLCRTLVIKLYFHLRPFCILLDISFSIYRVRNLTYWFGFVFSYIFFQNLEDILVIARKFWNIKKKKLKFWNILGWNFVKILEKLRNNFVNIFFIFWQKFFQNLRDTSVKHAKKFQSSLTNLKQRRKNYRKILKNFTKISKQWKFREFMNIGDILKILGNFLGKFRENFERPVL